MSKYYNLDKKEISFMNKEEEKIHIRVQQRNRRKCWTIVQGLDDDLDLKRICKEWQKVLKCNGSITDDAHHGLVIQLQGNHSTEIRDFLIQEQIRKIENIEFHGL